jgi:hypothetical protein
MRVNVGSPYNCTKIAIRYALGNILRPKFKGILDNLVTFQNDSEEVIFEFPELNYEYVNMIACEDIASFGQEEYGKFFYEYGRALLANLVVAFTKLDWHAFGVRSRSSLKFVGEYYDELLKLNEKASLVLDAFCDTIGIKHDENMPHFDFLFPSIEIIKIKQKNSFSPENPDMKNTQIMAFLYAGMWFAITGYLLLFCQKTDIDGLSRLASAADNGREANVFIKSIADSQEDDEKKINICSLIISYFTINRFFLLTSGLTYQDPLLELIAKIGSHLKDLIKDEEDLIIIDSDLINGNSSYGPSLLSFTDKYDPLDDIGPFSQYAILRSDNANIWAFGKEYVRLYREAGSAEAKDIPSLSEPALIKYIDKCAPISSYVNSENISIEKSFLFIKNIIKGVEKERIGTACPGTILQLSIIASSYRAIEKSSVFSRLNSEKKLLVSIGIDIIDTLMLLLYNMWFLSGKFFVQPSRPFYCENTAVSTLELLKEEVLGIFEEYFEYVKYGKNKDAPLFMAIIKDKLLYHGNISPEKIVNKYFPIDDEASYITECGKHGSYSIAYSALCNGIKEGFTIYGLADYAKNKSLDSQIIRLFSRYDKGSSTSYLEIPIIDAMFKAYPAIISRIEESPENFMVAYYSLLYIAMEQLLLKNSEGNYFDFNRAENLTSSYKVETIVNELVQKPLQSNLGFNSSDTDLANGQKSVEL